MAGAPTTQLSVDPRQAHGSRAIRRLRRSGLVPGVAYGAGQEPVAVQVDARVLRSALAHSGAVLELELAGAGTVPVIVKEQQRHPVSGELLHVDFLRVRLDRPIHATVAVELQGAGEAPGARDGGVIEQVTRELSVEALPTEIPDSLVCDVSSMEMNDTLTLSAVRVPPGVTLLDDPDTVVATLTPPRLQLESEEEIEEETAVLGERAVGEGEDEERAEVSEPGGAPASATETVEG